MKRVFADTFFYVAMTNEDDAYHAKADGFAVTFSGEIVTTEYVLVELGNWLAGTPGRAKFPGLVTHVYADLQTTIVSAKRSLVIEGTNLYARRPDKDWSLTDCISFVVMEKFGLADALTGDHHFEQAGFKALLL